MSHRPLRLRLEPLESRLTPVVGGLLGTVYYAVGVGPGNAPEVRVFDSSNRAVNDFVPFDSNFRGGVTVALADVNGDGTSDIIVGAGPGGGPHVEVFDGRGGQMIASFFAYDAGFTGGVNVAGADFNGDRRAEVVTGAGQGGGPHVKVFDLRAGGEIASFFADDPGFRGGVRVGTVIINNFTDIITGAGPGGGPRVQVFGLNGTQIPGPLGSFFAGFSPSYSGGVFVAGGAFSGPGTSTVLVGALGQVHAFDGVTGNVSVGNLNGLRPFGAAYGGVVPLGVTNLGSGLDLVTGRDTDEVSVHTFVGTLVSDFPPFNGMVSGAVSVG